MEEGEVAKESLAKRIAGEIVLSSNAGQTIQKWRNIFKIPQRTLADQLDIMPSVISDYENGRRLSPGIKIIKKMVDAMISLDEKTGGKVVHEFSNFPTKQVRDTIASMKEFEKPVTVDEFCRKLDAKIVVRKDLNDNKLYGYTVVDALKVIVEFSPTEMVKLYGLTNERALIFTGAHSGRSSMVALKVTNLKPGLVVLQTKDTEMDALAKRIAETEGIPVAIVNMKSDEVTSLLRKNYK
ncbi:MAG: helix-turn-helix domain-containing protein [Nanoarchaeota archaeon]|nr:helix-turn-helix domain-containing protein [Nanoarchaeota archaeon]MBU4124399.1 helix-turn-helix domain-containing protein [Nanoarchaeota archaeon]